MKRWVLAFVLCSLLHAAATVRAEEDGGTLSPIVLGVGAREHGMGRVGVAVSTSADALFWNSALLATLERPELTLYRTQLFVDGSVYHSGFLTYPTLDFGAFAFGYQRIDVSGIERTDARNRLLGSFDNGESNVLLGYGRQVGSLVSLGGVLRVAQQSLDAASDVGVGLDLGGAVRREFGAGSAHQVTVAANLQNVLEPRLRLDMEEVEDPRNVKLGLGYAGQWPQKRLAWVVGVDVDFPSRASARAALGAELSWDRMLSLRTGVDDGDPTFGLGVAYRNFRLDYALRTNETLSRNDLFTLAVSFGSSVTAKREARLAAYQLQVSEELERRLQDRERQETQRARAAADSAFTAADYEAALRLYRRVVAIDPTDSHAATRVEESERMLLLQRATALLDSGSEAQAAAAYQSILERWPDDAAARSGLAESRARLQRAADRQRVLRELFKEAVDRYTRNDLPGAESTLQELLRIQASHELGRELLDNVRATRKRRGEESLTSARRQAAAGRYDDALRLLKAARMHLGASKELDALAALWQSERTRSAAEAQRRAAGSARQAEDTAPRVEAHHALTAEQRREIAARYQSGLAAFTQGDFERATREWRAVWLEDPRFESVGDYLIKAYLFEGVELYGRGQYEAALERCRRVLEIDPRNEKAQRYLLRIQEEKLELEQIGGP